ncbi:MAG: dTDP-4-dehydrorhamnose 3,5-epimerase family protein [Candidatus Odinarchaeota archaeon]
MIDGIIIRDIKKFLDERGFFSELLREDWKDLLSNDKVIQFNLSVSYPEIVRAWHRHLKGQIDYFICISGAIKVCAYDDRGDSKTFGELDEIILNEEDLKVARIPGILWHGYKVIGDKSVKILYGVTNLYKYNDPDEERRDWNDQSIIPKTINGKTSDLRVGKPWDWYYSPNK